jgi:hypothetical protein
MPDEFSRRLQNINLALEEIDEHIVSIESYVISDNFSLKRKIWNL